MNLLIFAGMFSVLMLQVTYASADVGADNANKSEVQKNLFDSFVKEGVFVHFTSSSPPPVTGAGSFYLRSVVCYRDRIDGRTSCSFVDEARPLEERQASADGSKVIYDNLAASGVRPIPVPFSRGNELFVSASRLQCTKEGMREEFVKFACHRLKPLME